MGRAAADGRECIGESRASAEGCRSSLRIRLLGRYYQTCCLQTVHIQHYVPGNNIARLGELREGDPVPDVLLLSLVGQQMQLLSLLEEAPFQIASTPQYFPAPPDTLPTHCRGPKHANHKHPHPQEITPTRPLPVHPNPTLAHPRYPHTDWVRTLHYRLSLTNIHAGTNT